ncbi:Gfo/Idh/MocA family oxidoreductase [Sphingomonas sp. 3-13AW]|uniref:Gfo/Idh/MocA family oxidoreductase n=1 Tax=Sphingomonas sp. 3-13AW TaxID=3050450 RepID=UPI003BB60993
MGNDMPAKGLPTSRRGLLRGAGITGAGALFAPSIARAQSRGQKVNIACVGIGGRGADVVKDLHNSGLANVVALCDTEMGNARTAEVIRMFPDVPRFRDFREMFDKVGNSFQAVSIATPDFSHFPVAMQSMAMGKHIYCEKPMGHSVRQIQLMMDAATKYKVVTQMANQGHSGPGYFQFKAWTDAGIIKNVKRITTFMNSPRRWHGKSVTGFLPTQPVPADLDFDVWQATSKPHPYNFGYMVGEWRSWFDYGNGALGDWGAHIFDNAHEFLRLGLPTEVESVKIEGASRFYFPQASTLAFRFPARGAMPPVELSWYEGQQNLPPLPADFGSSVVDPNIPPPTSGSIETKRLAPGKVIYGEGLTFKGGSHASELEILGAAGRDLRGKLPKVPAYDTSHAGNFLRAVMGQEHAHSNFLVAGPLCQTMALGVIAQRTNAKLSFDPGSRRITNHKVADALLFGDTPRPEWEQYYRL